MFESMRNAPRGVEIVGHDPRSRLGEVNPAGELWASQPHTERLSAGAAHSSQMACWEPGGQDWLCAPGTFGRRSGHTGATPTSILQPWEARSRAPWPVRHVLTQSLLAFPLDRVPPSASSGSP